MFAHVTDSERHRICSLFEGIKTEADVVARFGSPDEIRDLGTVVVHPERGETPSRGEVFKNLIYKNLSPVADVVFNIGDGGTARGTWVQKYVGKKEA